MRRMSFTLQAPPSASCLPCTAFVCQTFRASLALMTKDPQWERLGEAVLQRRTEMDWTQQEVWDRGGPSDSLQSQIEHQRWRPTRKVRESLKKIDVGMRWASGSAAAVLAGGTPTPLSDDATNTQGIASGTFEWAGSARGKAPEQLDRIAQPAGGFDQQSLSDLIAAYVESHDQPAVERADAMVGATLKALRRVRQVLMRAADETVRAEAIDALNPAEAAANFLRDVIDEIKWKAGAADGDVAEPIRPPHWNESPLPPASVDEAEAASTGFKQSDDEDLDA
jgi:hypothetical protein